MLGNENPTNLSREYRMLGDIVKSEETSIGQSHNSGAKCNPAKVVNGSIVNGSASHAKAKHSNDRERHLVFLVFSHMAADQLQKFDRQILEASVRIALRFAVLRDVAFLSTFEAAALGAQGGVGGRVRLSRGSRSPGRRHLGQVRICHAELIFRLSLRSDVVIHDLFKETGGWKRWGTFNV